jgi:hypothetical protein
MDKKLGQKIFFIQYEFRPPFYSMDLDRAQLSLRATVFIQRSCGVLHSLLHLDPDSLTLHFAAAPPLFILPCSSSEAAGIWIARLEVHPRGSLLFAGKEGGSGSGPSRLGFLHFVWLCRITSLL